MFTIDRQTFLPHTSFSGGHGRFLRDYHYLKFERKPNKRTIIVVRSQKRVSVESIVNKTFCVVDKIFFRVPYIPREPRD